MLLCVATSVSTFIKLGCTEATCTCICRRTRGTHDRTRHTLLLHVMKPGCPDAHGYEHSSRPTAGPLLAWHPHCYAHVMGMSSANALIIGVLSAEAAPTDMSLRAESSPVPWCACW